MKRIFAIILAAVMMLSLSVIAFAADEVEIPLDADHVGEVGAGGAEIVTVGDNSVTADEIAIFALKLPENVAIGETVVVHIKGSSDSDFRVWLLADGNTDEKGVEATFSNQWKGSENGFEAPGEFEKYIELTAEDFDVQGLSEANRVAFKGASYGVNLSNTTLTYVGVIYGSMDDVEAAAVADAQPYADAANAALEAANAASDEASLNAALADAEAAVDALTEKAELGFPGVTSMLSDAKKVVKEINEKITSAAGDEALAAVQGDIDAVNNALAAAKSAAADDIDALKAALSDAQAAAANIQSAADAGNYADVTAAAKDAATSVSEIEKLVKTAEDAIKAAEEAAAKAAEEAAAKKQQTTTIVIIVVVAVVVIAVIAGVVVTALKKKKK